MCDVTIAATDGTDSAANMPCDGLCQVPHVCPGLDLDGEKQYCSGVFTGLNDGFSVLAHDKDCADGTICNIENLGNRQPCREGFRDFKVGDECNAICVPGRDPTFF